MSEANKDLGLVTAYGYAVASGYTGTPEEFSEDLATVKDKATIATQKAEEAAESAAEAEEAKDYAQAFLGAPRAAANAEAMTDHSLIYVYTGSETGYTNGHWYYWNGTAWADGGVYNSTAFTTDPTLSIAGMAADAAACGDLKSSLSDFEGAMQYVAYGVKQNGDIVFTSDDVNEGDILYYKLIASGVDGVAYIGFYDSSDTRLAYYGKGSGSSTVLTYEGTAEVPTGFSYCKVFTNNSLTLDIAYLYNGEPIFKKVEKLSTIIDSPFSVQVPDSIKGIIAFEFLDYDDGFKTYEVDQYRVNRYYYKTSGFYMYLQVQKLVNGSWSTFDAVDIRTQNAPTETKLMFAEGLYHRFKVAYLPTFLTAVSLGTVTYPIKNTSRQPFITSLQNQIDTLTTELQYGDYENKDTIKHVVTIDANGNGDFTTIADAYSAVTDSSYDNQYEFIIRDGTYHELNLIPPPYSHTHGNSPNGVIVTSEGQTGTLPVFDQKQYPSKLSNMTIISGTGYCIHNDFPFGNTGAVYNENLYCKKVYGVSVQNFGWRSKTNPSIIGAGAQYKGAKIVYNNCVFEDGAVVCHSNSYSVEEGNFHFVLKNCKCVNSWIQLNMAGNDGAAYHGMWICEIDGLNVPMGCPALTTKIGERKNNETWFGWQIIGGNNKNFSVRLDNNSDTLTTDIPWDNVNTNEKVYCQATATITKGQWLSDAITVANAEEKARNIFGVALADATSGETFPVWTGNAYMVNASNGEYGIGANGALSDSADEKIGKVIGGIFYRY